MKSPPASTRPARPRRNRRPPDIALQIALCVACLLLVASAAAADEVSAARSRTTTTDGVTERSYAGDVIATLRGSRIAADSAVVVSGTERYRFYRSIRFQDDRFTVHADSLVYRADAGEVLLGGRVRLSDGDRAIEAERVVYRLDEETVEATGAVRVRDDGTTIAADRWFRHAGRDSTHASGSVRLSRSGADSIQVRSRRLGGTGGILQFDEDVYLRQGAWEGAAATAVIEADGGLIRLEGDPEVRRVTADSDSLKANGSGVSLITLDNAVTRLELHGAARIRSARAATAEGGPMTTTIEADSALIHVTDRTIGRLEAFGAVAIGLRAGEASTDLAGKRAEIVFAAESPERILLTGTGSVRHEGPEVGADISGHGIRIDLADGDVKAVRVDSAAACAITGEHPTRLSGERLHLTFSAGRLAGARVEGGVEGRYTGSEIR